MNEIGLYGLANYALKNGGSIHPITLPPEMTGETGIMNPSIFLHNDRLLMNIRHVNYTLYHSECKRFVHPWGPLIYIHPENDVSLTTHNIMTELDEHINVRSSGRINMALDTGKPTWNFIGLEDGRLFEWENRLFLCGVRRDCYDDKGTGRMELCEIREINGEWTEVGRFPIPAPNDDATYCEKNWMPILDMPWHFVKWTNPTEVVRYDISNRTTKTVVLDESRKYDFPRDIRGGSQVIRLDSNHRMAITHEVNLFTDNFGRKDGAYMHRIVVWDNDWNIVKTTNDFTFMGGYKNENIDGRMAGIEFVTGVCFYKGDVLISFGLQDNASFVLRMPKNLFYEFVQKG